MNDGRTPPVPTPSSTVTARVVSLPEVASLRQPTAGLALKPRRAVGAASPRGWPLEQCRVSARARCQAPRLQLGIRRLGCHPYERASAPRRGFLVLVGNRQQKLLRELSRSSTGRPIPRRRPRRAEGLATCLAKHADSLELGLHTDMLAVCDVPQAHGFRGRRCPPGSALRPLPPAPDDTTPSRGASSLAAPVLVALSPCTARTPAHEPTPKEA